MAEVNAAPLYLPHHLAILLTPSPHLRAYDSAFALHAGLLASGTARLLLLIGVSAAAATLGGVLVVLLPLAIWWAAGMLMVYAAFAWWPWIWVASEHLARRTPTGRLWLASGGGRASPSLLSGRAPEARVAPISCSSACSQ